jgi:hypothetical protein
MTQHRGTRAIACASLLGVALLARPAEAHYCSNIWIAAARLVVKPETSTVHVPGGGPAQLKVYLQNNFPFKLFSVEMSGNASGYTVSVNPQQQDVHPGQNVLYTFSISGGAGDVAVTSMNLLVRFRVGDLPSDDLLVDPSPGQQDLIDRATRNAGDWQSAVLNTATLADLYPTATLPGGSPYFGRTALQQLISWFGYRFCYDAGGDWACLNGQNCPSPCAEGSAWTNTDQFPQECMRAGVELAVRKAKLGSELQAARDGAANAMRGGSSLHRCVAAVVGGVLWQGAADTSSFENGLSQVPAGCRNAGLRALGKGTAATCSGGAFEEQAACAAGEGLNGNDTLVKSVLMARAGDGDSSGDYDSLFFAYMLAIVTGDRVAKGQSASYYPSVGLPSPDRGVPPPPPGDGKVTPPGEMGAGDKGAGRNETVVRTSEAGLPLQPASGATRLEGGCTILLDAAPATEAGTLAMLCLGLILLFRWGRPKRAARVDW